MAGLLGGFCQGFEIFLWFEEFISFFEALLERCAEGEFLI
jgi:hypothetical protein